MSTPRPRQPTPPGLRDPVTPSPVRLSPPVSPAPVPMGMAPEVAEACGLDPDGPWPTGRAACGGVMPGPNDAAAIEAAYTRILAVGAAAGFLEAGAAPIGLSSLAGFDRAKAAEYFRRLLRVSEVAVFFPDPTFDMMELVYVDGAASYTWCTTWGDPNVGLEYWVGHEPLLSSVLGARDDWANGRDARMMAQLAPVLRAAHGAMRLSLRDGADRAFLLQV